MIDDQKATKIPERSRTVMRSKPILNKHEFLESSNFVSRSSGMVGAKFRQERIKSQERMNTMAPKSRSKYVPYP